MPEETVTINRAYEDVREAGAIIMCGTGPETAAAGPTENPNWIRNRAANYIALAEWIETKDEREAEATAARDKRRDELANELAGMSFSHLDSAVGGDVSANLIDRIIELEARP